MASGGKWFRRWRYGGLADSQMVEVAHAVQCMYSVIEPIGSTALVAAAARIDSEKAVGDVKM